MCLEGRGGGRERGGEGASHTRSENGPNHQCAWRGGEVGGRGVGRGHHTRSQRMDLIISVPGGEGRWEGEGASHTQSENGSYHQCAWRGREVGGEGREGHHTHGQRMDLIISVPGGGGRWDGEGRGGASHTWSENGSNHQCTWRGEEVGGRVGEGASHTQSENVSNHQCAWRGGEGRWEGWGGEGASHTR